MSSRVSASALFVACMLPLTSCTSASSRTASPVTTPQAAVDELLAADRAFAAAAAGTDVAGALESMFADDVLMPTPDRSFAAGRAAAAQSLRANPDNAGARLEWAPVRGGVSADGRHGFTFGYMTMYRAAGDSLPLKYMAYWVQTSDGWRVAAYKRGRRAPGAVSREMMSPAVPLAMVPPSTDAAAIERHRQSLADAERGFSNVAQNFGLGVAFQMHGSADAVNMGGPSDPGFVVGADAIGQAIGANAPAGSSPVSWAPDVRVIVASSGDLGVTLGYIRSNDPNAPAGSASPFFTVWRRLTPQHSWKYIAE